MIVKRRVRTYLKVKAIIWWADDSAQVLSKRLTNIMIIEFMNAATITIILSLYCYKL